MCRCAQRIGASEWHVLHGADGLYSQGCDIQCMAGNYPFLLGAVESQDEVLCPISYFKKGVN